MKPKAFIRLLFLTTVVATGIFLLVFSKKQVTNSRNDCQDQDGSGHSHSEFIIWETFTRNILGNS